MQTREAIAEQWAARVLLTYSTPPDQFRNPVAYTIRLALGILLDELLLGMDRERVTAALDSIVQIRAVQDLTPGHALEFLFQLKPILRESAAASDLDLVFARIDELALQAFDLYMMYRERIYTARTNEARRRVYLTERRLIKG